MVCSLSDWFFFPLRVIPREFIKIVENTSNLFLFLGTWYSTPMDIPQFV